MLLLWLLFNSSDVSALNIEFFWFILWSLQTLVFLLIFAGETSWIKHQFSLFSGVVGVGGFVLVGCIQVCVCVCVGVSGLRLSVMAQNFLSNWVKEDIKVGRGGSGVLVFWWIIWVFSLTSLDTPWKKWWKMVQEKKGACQFSRRPTGRRPDLPGCLATPGTGPVNDSCCPATLRIFTGRSSGALQPITRV